MRSQCRGHPLPRLSRSLHTLLPFSPFFFCNRIDSRFNFEAERRITRRADTVWPYLHRSFDGLIDWSVSLRRSKWNNGSVYPTALSSFLLRQLFAEFECFINAWWTRLIFYIIYIFSLFLLLVFNDGFWNDVLHLLWIKLDSCNWLENCMIMEKFWRIWKFEFGKIGKDESLVYFNFVSYMKVIRKVIDIFVN